ncbi:uncharacterized protein LOC111717524, partial [Eurytemora carolleeae]|uniref:uncharacterized protein LOC111717524 n=1 Tax=Eurytemora carolleeae TaxID=1294199 RepID=UPI000C7823A3
METDTEFLVSCKSTTDRFRFKIAGTYLYLNTIVLYSSVLLALLLLMYCLYCTDQMSNKIEIISRQIDNKTDEAVVRLNDLEMKLNTLTIDILTKKQEKSEPIWPMFDCSR